LVLLRLFALLSAIVVVPLGLSAAGCGGSDPAQTTLEQYLDDLRPALEDACAALEGTAAAFNDPDDPTSVATALDRVAGRLASAADAAAHAEPPDDLIAAHDGLLAYYRQGEEATRIMATLMAEIAGARTADELEALDRKWNETIAAAAADNMDTAALVTTWWESLEAEAERVGLDLPDWFGDLRQRTDAAREATGQ
jgi:hypothetical protein